MKSYTVVIKLTILKGRSELEDFNYEIRLTESNTMDHLYNNVKNRMERLSDALPPDHEVICKHVTIDEYESIADLLQVSLDG